MIARLHVFCRVADGLVCNQSPRKNHIDQQNRSRLIFANFYKLLAATPLKPARLHKVPPLNHHLIRA